jgi:lipopolysaccharide transport protein LptA
MRKLIISALLAYAVVIEMSLAQGPATKAETRVAEAAPSPAKVESKKAAAVNNAATADQPTITEIFADEAFFDSNKNIGKFKGHVKVNDPRFVIQSDRMTVYISKDQTQGLEKAVAEGNVGVVKDRPNAKGGPPDRTVGRSEQAIYTTSDGNIEMTGTPRVQQGMNTHIATTPETVMVLAGNGQLTTRGPSMTEIRQQPSPSPSAPPKP